MDRTFRAAALALVLAGLAASPALAQKSRDTLRYSGFNPTRTLDIYSDPGATIDMMSEAVFDTLVTQNLDTGEIAPLLAKSWTRPSPTVLEFELRDDVTWHDGEKFDADDVVSTLGWLIDPNTKILFKPQWSWIEKVEKLGPYKVRLTEKSPTPFDLTRLAFFTPIYPEHVFGRMTDKTQFGIKPIGTGPYKAIQVDINRGDIVEKNPDYKWGGVAKPQNNFNRYEVRYVPEASSMLARFITGETDILHNVGIDAFRQAQSQAPNKPYQVVRSAGFHVIAFPTAGQKLNPPLADPRVRRAIMMAVDRGAIEMMRSGERMVTDRLCYPKEPGCAQNVLPPAYDPAGAKKLLAEAGYANGFDLEITTSSSQGTRPVAEAVAGFLNAVGIRARIDPLIQAAMRQKWLEKRAQMTVHTESAGVIPDSSSQIVPMFLGPHFDDPKIKALAEKTIAVIDDAERRKVTAELLDYVTEQALMMPIQTFSRFILHGEDVEIRSAGPTTFYTEGFAFRQLGWKK